MKHSSNIYEKNKRLDCLVVYTVFYCFHDGHGFALMISGEFSFIRNSSFWSIIVLWSGIIAISMLFRVYILNKLNYNAIEM